jgi:hypothetical protein
LPGLTRQSIDQAMDARIKSGHDEVWNPRDVFALSPRNSLLEEQIMPILLWLLGVPLGLVLVLMLFGIA